ncbi:hypothetical protein PF010_g411 [Phytophthora fragariae]|uniref:Elicitin n=2 Tax=Phytophthora TaxID=4783 RepID=A0A6G0PVM3_9STRA|nr:hypothetical protein PR002_g1279 [Phytophthora rubi]KAE9052505.1 hypothetical protein PR001_g452 [Phytophthora rubi]KAE9139891.1 hypothetical protein PF010_g411 [Phytophthora fragariae]KAE9255873.1 hypothetical protein PF004_g373 [Phytophthora fragariae]KAE9359730.1 hypothetical protein PR003_g601 [Phytophthora rubi]
MQVHLLLVFALAAAASVVVVASQSTNATDAAVALVYDIPECTDDQLNIGESILITEPSTLQCEAKFGIATGMLLQSASMADELCSEQCCLNALRTLYATLPNCRYELWGLQYSASKFLNHCGIATNTSTITYE